MTECPDAEQTVEENQDKVHGVFGNLSELSHRVASAAKLVIELQI